MFKESLNRIFFFSKFISIRKFIKPKFFIFSITIIKFHSCWSTGNLNFITFAIYNYKINTTYEHIIFMVHKFLIFVVRFYINFITRSKTLNNLFNFISIFFRKTSKSCSKVKCSTAKTTIKTSHSLFYRGGYILNNFILRYRFTLNSSIFFRMLSYNLSESIIHFLSFKFIISNTTSVTNKSFKRNNILTINFTFR